MKRSEGVCVFFHSCARTGICQNAVPMEVQIAMGTAHPDELDDVGELVAGVYQHAAAVRASVGVCFEDELNDDAELSATT